MLCKFQFKSTVASSNKPKTKLKCGYCVFKGECLAMPQTDTCFW